MFFLFSSFFSKNQVVFFLCFFLLLDFSSSSYNTLQSSSFFAEEKSSVNYFYPLVNNVPDFNSPFIGLNISRILTATCSSSGFCDYFNVIPEVEFDLANSNWTTITSSNAYTAGINETQLMKTFVNLNGYNSNFTWSGTTSKSGIPYYSTPYGNLTLPSSTIFYSFQVLNGGLPGNTLIIEWKEIFDPSILGQKQYLGSSVLLNNNYRSIEFGFPFGLNVTFGSISSATVDGNTGVPANIQYQLTNIVTRIGISLGSSIKFDPLTYSIVGTYNPTSLTTGSIPVSNAESIIFNFELNIGLFIFFIFFFF